MGCSGQREKGVGVGVVQVASSQRNAFFAGAFPLLFVMPLKTRTWFIWAMENIEKYEISTF